MKKLRINWYSAQFDELMKGVSRSSYALAAFSWSNTPQGRKYWAQKYDKAWLKTHNHRREQRALGINNTPWDQGPIGMWDDILTEDDWGYLRAATRDRRKFNDKFVNSKKHKEYVEYADGLPTSSEE